ncbi:MAG: helix-turn-helix domain-containing protein [Patescibacteria group bacterium]|jgi:sugar-specific transcriptional regulator TrmB
MKTNINLKPQTLELLGLKAKDLDVYLAVLKLGSAPLRRVAEASGYNRGTSYDAIKRLIAAGLISYVDAKPHRYFTAEDPQKLRGLATRREVALQEARQQLDSLLPDFQALAGSATYRPTVRYYEGKDGIKDILKDVLKTTERTKNKTYRIYSSSKLRELIAAAWPSFLKTRIELGVHVKAISIGPGGETAGLDERKWLSKEKSSSAYIFIYGKKTAYVSADEFNKLFGAIIDDENITSSQTMIFDALWKSL